MGGRSSTSQQTATTSNQLGFELEDEAQAIGVVGNNNQVSMLDHGAIGRAFDFASGAAVMVEKSLQDSAQLVRDSNRQSLDTMRDSNRQSLDAMRDTNRETIESVSQAQKADSQQVVDKIVNYIPIIAVVGGVIYIFKGKK